MQKCFGHIGRDWGIQVLNIGCISRFFATTFLCVCVLFVYCACVCVCVVVEAHTCKWSLSL